MEDRAVTYNSYLKVYELLTLQRAFSDKDQLKGRYVDTTAENFAMTMNISCYSFTALAQRAARLMPVCRRIHRPTACR